MCVPQVWERFTDQCVYESDRFGGGSVMIWAGIYHDGRTQLKIVQGTSNAVKYRDDILKRCVVGCESSNDGVHEPSLVYWSYDVA
jgi:hypothetical protein